ncbi:type VII secretion system-associated protein [Streptomyces panaciradicis]|uniref:type VII secretion system-associated protein n=1 Tax=Streptomyces panaciradicis TaxID=1470261 RepID=UPI00201CB377|nr:type VII secretion system-associated protein [Streptomyces panaciradicis]MCL6673745.1 type VII secretion system-associated protein [Streptomyces panaciradicis]
MSDNPAVDELTEDAPPPVLSWPVVPTDVAADGTDAETQHSSADATDSSQDSDASPGTAIPTAPEHIQNAALLAPDHWFGLVDVAWTGAWPPPHWAVVGQWRSDAAGRLVEWQRNPEYLPSPAARGWPRPTDPIDAAVQRAAAGYGQDNEVPRLVARSEVATFIRPDGQPVVAVAPDGSPVVPVYTSQHQLDGGGRLAYEIHAVPDLVEWLPEGHALYVNPSAAVAMRVDPEALDQALAEFREENAGEDERVPADGSTAVTGVDRTSVQEAAPGTGDPDTADLGPDGSDPAVVRPVAGEADESLVAAARIETAGSAPAPVVAGPAPIDTAEDTPDRGNAQNVGESASAPGLAETAAAALMAPTGR